MHFLKFHRGSLFLGALTAIWAALLSSDSVSAQSVPALINYQGQIQNPNGTLPPTADYTLTFRIYDAAQGGVLVWGPQVYDGTGGLGRGGKVPLVQGFFNVLLGPVDTTGRQLQSAFTDSIRYLEVQLGTNPPIAPRQQLLSAPFALRAGGSDFADDAGKLAGFDWSHVLNTNDPVNGKLSGNKIADSTISTSQLGDGVVTSSKLALQAVTTDRIASNAITAPQIGSGAVGSNQIQNGQITRGKLDAALLIDAIIPPGTILPYGGNTNTVPAGWMPCDGRTVSRTNYIRLFTAILTAWGQGDGVDTFHIPDLRGLFLRGVNHGRSGSFADPGINSRVPLNLGGNPGNNVGSHQFSQTGEHTHGDGNLTARIYVSANNNVWYSSRTISSWTPDNIGANGGAETWPGGVTQDGAVVVGQTSPNGGNTTEARPANAYVNYIIKY